MFRAVNRLLWMAFGLFIILPVFAQGLTRAQAVMPQSQDSNAANNDWPRCRGANYNGASVQKNVFGENAALEIVWKKKLGSGYSAISIANGRAMTMFSDGEYDYLISLDADSGNEQWRYRIDTTYPGRDGANPGPVSTPTIDDDRVFGIGPKGQLVALDLKTGKALWSTHLIEKHHAVRPHWGFTTSPLIYGDLLIVETGGTQNNAMTAFNKATGKVVWSAGADTVDYQSPLIANIAGRPQLLWAGEKSLFGFEPDTGKELWRYLHGGDGFHQRIVNPVVVEGDRLLLTNQIAQAKLIRLTQNDAGFAVDEIWKSADLKRNFNIPVYYEGYIYGFSGDFLTCVEANSGKLAWKSRPPGNGFTIVVDGHLAVMTKSGSLHVAKASPAGYFEIASLQLFDKLVWSPPSFANGKFYARNSFDEIACVAVVNRSLAAVERSSLPPSLSFPNSAFGKFVKRAEAASDKRALIDEFIKSQKQFPVIEGDSLAHIIYYGEAREVALRGDMFDFGDEILMRRLSGTDFFYASFKFAPDAFLSYRFVKDLEQRIADPRNPHKVSTTTPPFAGEASELYMPRSEHPQHFDEPATTRRGRLDTLTFASEKIPIGRRTWGGEHRIQVYLPPGYDATTKRYPAIYVNNGDNAIAIGKMKNTLDNLIGKTVQPVIAVFIQSISSYEFARLERELYARMVAEKLVPFIDKKYRTMAKPEARAILGGDEGGYAALNIGFRYPDVFGKVAGQSVCPIAEGGPELMALAQKSPRLPLKLYLDWGKYDFRYSLYGEDPRGFSQTFVKILQSKKYQIAGGEVNEGSDYASWRRRTDKILQTLFPQD
jgi:enterochelin esterase-like enzyme/outer membrane protein assembly factor BamB